MAKKKGGLIQRLIIGSEKSEGYARASLPSNRWELFWDILKGRFGKLIIVNLLMLLFFIPLVALLFLHYSAMISYGTSAPFGQGFGVGFMAPQSMVGFPETITFNVNLVIYLFMPIAFMIASIGISGGAYVIRNMVWTEGIFVANDFWRGIKQNVKQILLVALLYSIVFYGFTISLALANKMIVEGIGVTWLLVMSKVVSYIVIIFISIMVAHMITMVVTYKVTFRQLIKNSFIFTIGLLPHNIVFTVAGLLPMVFLFFSGIMAVIGYLLIIFFAFSFYLLVWTDYCQWIYDKINDKVPGAKKGRGLYEKIKESDSKALQQYRAQLVKAGRSSLNSKPIKPITDDDLQLAELPQSFNRNDIEKLNESRQVLYDDHARYVEEHKNDPEFQKTEEEIQLEKEEKERELRIAKAKKALEGKNRHKKN